MIHFTEDRFPTDISIGAVGGPEFNTTISTTTNGQEYRNIGWNNARCRYNISYGIKSKQQLENLISFFRSKKGKAIGFRFKDYTDFQARNQLIGTGNSNKREFQLIKIYGNDNRKITKPVENTVKIYLDGTQTTNFSIDCTTGIIKFSKPPIFTEQITADFDFDVPVRFENDYLPLSNCHQDFYSIDNISLIEIKI